MSTVAKDRKCATTKIVAEKMETCRNLKVECSARNLKLRYITVGYISQSQLFRRKTEDNQKR